MKIAFSAPTDNKTHRYCIACNAEAISKIRVNGYLKWQCSACGQVNDRYIHLGNTSKDGKWWIADDGELWHESAGVFVRNREGKYLFFERVAYPLGYTIPAGHVDNGEAGEHAAIRELQEEVGIGSEHLTPVITTKIVGDMCIGAADSHLWHVYREDLAEQPEVRVLEEDEGRAPVWMTLDEALTKQLPFAVRYLIDNYADQIGR
ncbi:MAG TPA: NUDIX domain-containing protein [Candidatus Saccharimonadales bacterium]|nr:NUDIX domain-containing protein [Candidatus Saccharimonadales bacterium]